VEMIRLKAPRWADGRGHIKQPWNMYEYHKQAISAKRRDWPRAVEWVQDNVTVSELGVLRGIHGYHDLWRLCACVFGEVHFVVVDCREDGEFGQWAAVNLDPKSDSILVPPGFGMAALTLSDLSVFYYKWSGIYGRHEQFAYKWSDPRFGIKWPFVGEPILSERDR